MIYVIVFFCFLGDPCQSSNLHEYHYLVSDNMHCQIDRAKVGERLSVHGLVVRKTLCIPESEYMRWVKQSLDEGHQ